MNLIIDRAVRLNGSWNFFFLRGKELFLEEQDGEYADGDGGIGNIEDWPEEFKRLAAPYRHPFGDGGIGDDREIQHIHHFTVQETRITACKAFVHKRMGHILGEGIAVFKDQSVEKTIDQITNGACIDQCSANNEAEVIFTTDDMPDIERSEDHRHQSEQREGHLAPLATQLPAIGHPFILDEMEAKPIGDQVFLTQEIVGLDINLEDLINKQDK